MFSLPVFADLIVEPVDDFFSEHRDECVYNNDRKYIVNTDKGYAYLYANPESNRTIRGYSNGDKVTISWLYTDKSGEVWGVLFSDAGWFRMSDLTVVYDSFSFLADHASEMEEYVQGTYSVIASESEPVAMWRYPGNKSDAFFKYDTVSDHVTKTFTDENETVWGYISYYMGMRNVWVCLSDPNGNNIGSINGQTTAELKADPVESDEIPTVYVEGMNIELKAEPTPTEEIPMNDGNVKLFIIIGALVAGVVVITAAVIIVFKKTVSKRA